MAIFESEEDLLNKYRLISSSEIGYCGNPFCCSRIERLTRSIFYRKSWKNNSLETNLPPDYINEKHHFMMEVMLVDDCIGKVKGKHVPNTFERTNKYLENYLGKGYKKKINSTLFFNADTRDNIIYNYEGYRKNFAKVVGAHSEKRNEYFANHPKCRKLIFLIFDYSNPYFQYNSKDDKLKHQRKNENFKCKPHNWYADKYFLDIIKKTNADYIIWVGWNKLLLNGNKVIKQPRVCIYHIKSIKRKGIEYNTELIAKP